MEAPFFKLSARERLLVTGVEGMLGANLALVLADPFIVEGLFLRPIARKDADRHARRLSDAVRALRPAWIIHCGILARANWDPPIGPVSGAVEARLVAGLAQAADEVGARLTVLSTDAVLRGPRLFHGPAAPAGGHSAWSRAVRRTEQAADNGRALIVRTHAFGWSPTEPDEGFTARLVSALRDGRALELDGQQHATPILATDLADLLVAAYRTGLSGIHHLAGAERVSTVRFAQELADVLGVEPVGLAACHAGRDTASSDAPPAGLRAYLARCETALDTRLAQTLLGRPMPRFQDGLRRLLEQVERGYRTRLRRLSVVIPARAA